MHLHTILSCLHDHILPIKHPKCFFFFYIISLYLLGHMISSIGIALYLSKIAIIHDMAAPTDAPDLSSFFGYTKLYKRFVPQYTYICALLTNLLSSCAKCF